jgi:DNA invertase Pin-like site-specific DNA recombinase
MKNMPMNKTVSYYRVSTNIQRASGLGLEAQQKSVKEYAEKYNLELIKEFTEIESGKNNKRPILLKALIACKKSKAILLIAKLDRLGRNVAFISKLMESDVDFVAVDNPHASKFFVHMMAAFAEYERDQISVRTKEALQAAKRRGVKLGEYGKNVLSKKNKQSSVEFALKMTPIIQHLKGNGYKTVRSLAKIMNQKQIKTFSGHKAKWHVNSVHRLLKQIELCNS